MGAPPINWAVYKSLPPAEAQYQLDHINESRVRDIVSSHVACLVIAVVAIFLRFVSRRMSKTAIKADDWMIVAALVFAVGYIISVLLCVLEYGGGRHAILLVEPVMFAQASHHGFVSQWKHLLTYVSTQSVLAAECFYPPAIASVKISTLFLYSRIFPGRRFRILLYTVGIFVIVYSGIMVLSAIFQCIPVRGGWDTTVKAQCIKINTEWMIMAGMNVLTDFVLLCAPLPTLWGLQMQRALKAQLMAVFGIGGFVCVISIYRIPKLYGLSLVDASWSNADPTIWSLVEVCIAIACACAIVYRPLFDRVSRFRSSATGSYGSRKNSKPKLAGWDSNDGNAVKMQRVHTYEKGSVGRSDSESRLKDGGWQNFT